MRRLAFLISVSLPACGDPNPSTQPSDVAPDSVDGRDAVQATDLPSDVAVDPPPAGAEVLEEVSGRVSASDQLALQLDGVRLLVAPDASLAGTTITFRLLDGVVKSGPLPRDGRVVQILPSGLVLSTPAELRFSPDDAGPFVGLSAAEDDAAWSTVPVTPIGIGEQMIELPHFSLWAIALPGAGPGSVSFAGLAGARTATDGGGGIVLRVPRATSTATHDWFGFAGGIFYFAYVATTSGAQDFDAAHGVLFDALTDPDPAGTVEYRLVGLTAGANYCVVVRARDVEGAEDQNTVEHCAVAAAMDPAALSLDPIVPSMNANAAPFLVLTGRCDRVGARLDFERSLDGTTWVPFDARLVDRSGRGGGATTNDMPPPGVPVSYRVKAYDRDVLVGTSAVAVATLPPLDHHEAVVGPKTTAALPGAASEARGRPALYLDGRGRMIFAGHATSTTWATANVTNPVLDFETHDLDFGTSLDPTLLHHRMRCGIASFARPYATGFGSMAFARAADGVLYFTDGVFALYRLDPAGSGCAEVVATLLHPSVHQVVTDPMDATRLALLDPTGVYTSTNRGATFLRWVPVGHSLADLTRTIVLYQPLGGLAWSPDGTRLWAGLGAALATSNDGGATFAPETWASDEVVAAIAVRSDGVAAVLSGAVRSQLVMVIGPPGALAPETLPGTPSAGLRELLWLGDGRLLVMSDNPDGFPGASRYLAVRDASGGWSRSRIAAPRDAGPVFVDPAAADVIYAGLLRSSDGGATWDQMAAGYARGVTTVAGGGSRLLVVAGDPNGGVSSERRASTDRGETWTAVTEAFHDVITFNPESPLLGVAEGGAFTTDGGLSWAYGTGIDAARTQELGWVGTRIYTCSRTEGGFRTSPDGGASWADVPPNQVFQFVPRLIAGNGLIAAAIGLDTAGPVLAVDTGIGMAKVAPPGVATAGGARLGGLAFARGATASAGVVYAVVVAGSEPLTSCRGVIWKSANGLAGPWTELFQGWTAAGWRFGCHIRVDPFAADPPVITSPVAP